MDISINPTMMVLQAVPFLLTLLALHAIIFKPMLAYLEQREAAISNGRKEAARLNADATEKLQDVEERLRGTRNSVSQRLAQRRASAQGEYDQLLKGARIEAEASTTRAVAGLADEASVARIQLAATTQELADRVTVAVLGRAVANG